MMHNCLQNINLVRKTVPVLCLMLIPWDLRGDSDVNHVIIRLNGQAIVTLIDSMSSKSIYTSNPETGRNAKIPLKTVYLVFNDFNRIYYLSPSFQDRIDYLEDWGGTLETVNGKIYNYTSIRFNRAMKKPEIHMILESDSARGISLFDVYKIRADKSATELSVIRGFKAGVKVILLGTTIDIVRYYFRNKDSGLISVVGKGVAAESGDLLPGYKFLGMKKTGVTYESVVFGIPAATMGLVIYDTVKGKRTSYFIPRDGTGEYPGNMYYFNPKRIYRNWKKKTISSIKSKIPPLPKIPFINK